MKSKKFRKLAAAIAACTVMASALPAVPAVVSAASNIISNSTFDSGTSGWGTYKESGGVCSLGTENGRLALTVSNVGKVNYAVQVFYDIIPLYQNGVYRIKYDISSTTDRYIEAMIQQNGGTYQAYTWKGLNLTSTPQTVDYEFTMDAETDIMSKLVFNCGIQEKYEGVLPEHKIYIDNVSLELVDDSKVDYSATRPYEAPIITNQVGYKCDSKKTAVFRNADNENKFSVVNADTNQVVYTGDLSGSVNNTSAGETNKTGDFSSVTQPGKYYITCGNLDNSYTFEISDSVYSNLLNDSVRMLYLQRCGEAVTDSDFGHPACHTGMATVYGTNDTIDVSGGWHDAGDYGRYIVPAAKTIADLLYAYEANPELYGDNIGIPESGNGTPDILDEARYELEWMMKMQRDDGAVYHKVTCENFPGYVSPEKETAALIVTPVSTTATADFCASMALAYEFYKDIDASFANNCLERAERAWSFLEANPNMIFKNPEDITTGDYGDTSDRDERYWAAAQLYRATGNSKYETALSEMFVLKGLDWSTVGDYGNLAILTAKNISKDSAIYTNARDTIISQADSFVRISSSSPYGVALTKFDWGSNMTVANAGIILGAAYKVTGDSSYLDAANAQLNYLLGTNPVGECFFTGYGTVSPENPHHRPSMAAGKAMKGMLVGGVNQNLEDSAAKAYCQDLPAAKRYVDNAESYSTNEITIYWNSPLTYLVSLTSNEDIVSPDFILGDINSDGSIDSFDIVLARKGLINSGFDDTTAAKAADVNQDGKYSVADTVLIQQFVLGTIKAFPKEEQPIDPPVSGEIKDYGTAMNQNASVIADFRKGETPVFFASDGWTNGSCFDCGWYKQNTSFDGGVLNLTIDKDHSGKYNYSGAEYRTADTYHYGYYETSMQAIKNDGVVSSFFTYTGPSEDNPWDEIDIEVLGKDTTKVQFNYYTNGVGNHEYMYDLGFDASEGFHTYGFDWQPDHITWYVDGKAVYTASDNIPSTAGRIMMNAWPGIGVDDWLKPFNGNTPLTARYQWVTYNKQ
ncbi:MAG: glycoside hydrolase family 9 protein [Ruminococcus sp.]|nr:glycoside hydrolase family 9 protein [Ruminococcus sp.]